mgnify:CR=1 FL=1
MSVNLEKVAVVPLGMDERQMNLLFASLDHFFQYSKKTQLLKPMESLSKVEMRLQHLPGITSVIPAGDQGEWIEKVDPSNSGLVVACPQAWIDYFSRELFIGATPMIEVNVGKALTGRYGINDGLQVVPFIPL